MRRIYLVRHGETDANRDRIIQGQSDSPRLTARGRLQIERAAAYFSTLEPLGKPVIWYGPLTRLMDSSNVFGNVLGGDVDQILDHRLIQRSWGSVQGMQLRKLNIRLNSEEVFLGEPGKELPTDAESLQDVRARISSFLDDLKRHAATLHVVISHNELLNYMWNILEATDLMRHNIDNGEVIRITWDESAASVERVFPRRLVCGWHDVRDGLQGSAAEILRLIGAESQHIRSISPDEYGAVRVLIIGDAPFGPEEAGLFPTLELVARYGTGYDNVLVKELAAHNIRTLRLLGGSEDAVAEFVLASAIMALSLVPQSVEGLRKTPHVWRAAGKRGMSLSQARIGVIGYGRVGRAVAQRFRMNNADVRVWNRSWNEKLEAHTNQHGIRKIATLQELLRTSDVVTIHIALTEQTRGMISEEVLQDLSKTGHHIALINVARGGIVDERALLTALNNGTVSSAVIDVWSVEGQATSPVVTELRAHPLVMPTPHIASYTTAVADHQQHVLATAIVAFLERRYSSIIDAEIIKP